MKEIGGTPEDAGGKVVFTGRDPILRSHFHIVACMAIPAMAAAVGAAAIWRERTGQDHLHRTLNPNAGSIWVASLRARLTF